MRKSIFHRVTARLRKHAFYSGVLTMTGKSLTDRKWIFIIGCYNSGTTLLDRILSSHEHISGLPDEGVMLTNQLARPEDFGWRRMWWKCEDKLSVSKKDSVRTAKIIQRQWSHFYDTRKAYLIEKSIANTCRIPFFEKEFNSPYFIHIIRNGYAVAEGIQRKALIMEGNPLQPLRNYPIEYCIGQWKRSLEVVERDRFAVKNFLEIRYENLADKPMETIKDVLSFFNLPPMRTDFFTEHFSVHENLSQIKNMNHESIGRLTKFEIDAINRIAGNTLSKYHYPILTP